MDLKEYKELILENIRLEANINISDITSEFIKYVSDILISAEEFDDFTETYFETLGKNELITITNSEIDKLFSRMEAFVENSLNGYICDKCEESSEGYGFAKEIKDRRDEITKFRFYIITDKILSDRVKAINKESILGKPTEVNIWDLSR